MDFGKVAGAFALGGLSGGAAEYNKIQEEQRRFQQEQALRDAEELRQQRLKEFGVNLEMQNRVVGQRQDGTVVTQGQVESGAVQPGTYSTERQVKLEDAKSGQFLNGRELTNAEVKALSPEQQAQLKTAQQQALIQHEEMKKIDAKYREPRQDALGTAKQLYDYKNSQEEAQRQKLLKEGVITKEEYDQARKAEALGAAGMRASASEDKLLPGVNKLREAVVKAGEAPEDPWDGKVAEAKAFLSRYDSLNSKEKAQADELFPGMEKQAFIISGTKELADAGPDGATTFVQKYLNRRGVAGLPKSDPRKQEAIQELKEINSLYSQMYQTTDAPSTGILDSVWSNTFGTKRKQVTRKE